MKQLSALTAALNGKCPRCRLGDMFISSPLNLIKSLKMNEKCPKCNLKFEVEPGFFFGAMYVSYAFSVAILIITTILLYVLANDPEVHVYIISVTLLSFFTYPFNFRFSRILFLHLFSGVKYIGTINYDH
jgi:uncharacterized protein (DUF983 family)